MSRLRAVVLANGLNGLGAVRSLGSAGVHVTCVAAGTGDPAWQSRYAAARHRVPRDSSDSVWLEFLARHARGAAVVPTSDPGVSLLARLRDALPPDVRVVVPPDSVGERLVDKRAEIEAIAAHGIPLPRSVTELPPAADGLHGRLALPVIIKPVLLADTEIIRAKNLQAATEAELARAWERMQGRHDRFIAQEIVPGDDSHLWVCNATFDVAHRMVAAFTFQRLRTSPPHYGVTCSAVSRRNDEVLEAVAALGRALGYVGPAMFEFKRHPATGEYLYIEINPRIGMCNWFDTRCGVNNVLAACQVALHGTVPQPLPPQAEGAVFIDLFADLYSRLADGETVGRVARDYAGHLRARRVAAYFYARDPMPGIRAAIRNAAAAWRIAGGLARRRARRSAGR